MIDLQKLTEPCPRCSEYRAHLYHLNNLVHRDDGYASKLKLIGRNFGGEPMEISELGIECTRCNGKGVTLTDEGKRLIAMVQEWMPLLVSQ